ncbi:MAG: chloride channel protein, partial [Acidobacteriota bacterium]
AVLFTLEEILADLHARLVGSVVIGAATSWIVLRLILGDEPLFHVPAYQLVHPVEFLIYALLGIVGGLVSTGFVKLLLWQRAHFLRAPKHWKAFTPAVGGLVVGALALAQPGVLGVGYNLVSDALNGRMGLQIMLVLMVLKIVATSTSYSSGNAGGIFGPSLFIGAMLGGAVGQVAHSLFPDHTGNAGAYALVGMGAAFAGIVRTPMTSVIMIFEVTRDYTIIVPLMIANLCSYLLAQRLQRVPIYEALLRQEGITMPSPAHLPTPLSVESAMQARTPGEPSLAIPPNIPYVHPDDPLDAALQRMGAAGLDELPVLSRMGQKQIGALRMQHVLDAYKKLSERPGDANTLSIKNWVPAVAAITVAAVLIVSGLVFWQHSRQSDLGREAYQNGQGLLAQGQLEEAASAFRGALAHAPDNVETRISLGLALVDSDHADEASSYLSEAAKAQPQNGLVWMGLAKIARSNGDKKQAIQLLQQSFAREWPAQEEPRRKDAELEYAGLLAESGRSREAVSLLLSMIEQSGDNAAIGRRAADAVKRIGSPEQVESAYAALTVHFPADSGVWTGLGDARYAAGKDAAALEAYQQATKADAGNGEAQASIARLGEIMSLDPTPRSLAFRERVRRWEAMLQRTVTVTATCSTSPEIERATIRLKQRALSLDALDKRMESVLSLWKNTDPACKADPVLAHIMAKLGE